MGSMNGGGNQLVTEELDEIATARGKIVLEASGALQTRVSTGPTAEDTRPAEARDGLAALLVDAVLSRNLDGLSASRGRLTLTHPPSSPRSAAMGLPHRERVIPVDMTNWSVIVDEYTVVKVVGSWGSADRAARQLSRLAETGPGLVPAFLGSLDWEHPRLGQSTIALVSELIPDAADGWSWAVDDVLAFLQGGARPEWPSRLGRLAAGLHAALIPFADVAASRPEGAALRARADASIDEALRATEGPAGTRLRNREQSLRAIIAGIPDTSPGPVFDLHGDLHVGQVLRAPTASGLQYWAIDFDGDPQLTPEERDRPDYAARDLAHLLCSVELVGSVVMRRRGGASAEVLDWASAARSEMLQAYRGELATRGHLDALDERLLDGFMVEQLMRELIYADQFLPRWQYAPDAVLTFRYQPHPDDAAPNPPEEPWTPPVFTTT